MHFEAYSEGIKRKERKQLAFVFSNPIIIHVVQMKHFLSLLCKETHYNTKKKVTVLFWHRQTSPKCDF